MSVIVAQLGARMHYAVPRIFNDAGILERLYTDFYVHFSPFSLLADLGKKSRSEWIRRMMGRYTDELPRRAVMSFNSFGLRYAIRRRLVGGGPKLTSVYLWAGRTFCGLVKERGFGNARTVYAFNSAALEIFQEAQSKGITTVLEQTIAPYSVELDLLREERARYPEWEERMEADEWAAAFVERERAEWAIADVILCGSEFVRESITRAGGDSHRCIVVPYGVDLADHAMTKSPSTGPLRVLSVGRISLRKGAPYILEAAKQLRGKAVFRLVGSSGISPTTLAELEAVADVVGSVPRSEVGKHYNWADVLLTPSIIEGSATVTYEALAAGVPVICTPNTGSVVRDGVDGFLVPAGRTDALVDSIAKLIRDRSLLRSMQESAKRRAHEYTVQSYGKRLLRALRTEPRGSLNA